jgi:ATP-dependent Clp protease ATP-binding subunit ClpC
MRINLFKQADKLSDRARKAFQLAHQEAHRLNHEEVDTIHLLLGVAKESISAGSTVLQAAGFDLPWLRRELERRRPRGKSLVALPGALPYSRDLQEFVILTLSAGESTGLLPLGVESLLLVMIEQWTGIVDDVLSMRPKRRMWLAERLRALAQSDILRNSSGTQPGPG